MNNCSNSNNKNHKNVKHTITVSKTINVVDRYTWVGVHFGSRVVGYLISFKQFDFFLIAYQPFLGYSFSARFECRPALISWASEDWPLVMSFIELPDREVLTTAKTLSELA